MENIIENIRARAASFSKHLVFPEGEDQRVRQAAQYLVQHDVCEVTLIADADKIQPSTFDQSIQIIDAGKPFINLDTYAQAFWQRRKEKLENEAEAQETLKDPLYYAAAMVQAGHADGCVAGSIASTGNVIRPAIQCIGLKEYTDIISSCFLMAIPDGRTLTYADCGVVPYPDTDQLADIAVESARTHKLLTQTEPVAAMLSFSTKGSAKHPRVELVQEATELVKNKNIEFEIDGELQFDAAFVPGVAERKAPESAVAGKANVFVFPNIDAGNIGYKITERLAGATATGPILQGLAQPMMDLSRGCSWQDIVNAACVAILFSNQ